MKKLRIGVVGLGDISRVYIDNLKKYSDYVTIEACASRTLEKAQKKADAYGIPHAYSCAEELIEQADVDLILNLTTPDAHYRLNKLALTCGKHVYTEKPLAFTYAEGKELIDLAQSKNLRIGCAPDTFLGARLQTCRASRFTAQREPCVCRILTRWTARIFSAVIFSCAQSKIIAGTASRAIGSMSKKIGSMYRLPARLHPPAILRTAAASA